MTKPNDTSKINWADSFYYDETSPSCLRWNIDVILGKYNNIHRKFRGDVAGNIQVDGHWLVTYENKRTYVHRIIIEMFGNKITQYVDHIDGNPLNNKIFNLRCVSQQTNLQNKCMQTNNSSGHTGVSFYERKLGIKTYQYWRARWFSLDGKEISRFFSVNKLGDAEAKDRAVNCRNLEIAKLIVLGAEYTDRHGK